MKSIGKAFGILFLIILLAVVSLAFSVTHFIDPNDYKDQIRQLVREKTNVDLTIQGKIGWSLFPWIGFEITNTTAANVYTPKKPFANARLLGFTIKILPLLRQKIELHRIRADGLTLNLTVDKQGYSNWEGIKYGSKAQPTRKHSTDFTKHFTSTSVDSVIINGARINYSNQKTGQHFNAESIQITSGSPGQHTLIPIKASALFNSEQPVLQGKVSMQADLSTDSSEETYSFTNAKLSGEVKNDHTEGKALPYMITGKALINAIEKTAKLDDVQVVINDVHAKTHLKITNLDSEPELSGALSVESFNPRHFIQKMGKDFRVKDKRLLSKISLNTNLSGTLAHLKFEKIKALIDKTTVTGSVSIKDLKSNKFNANLKADKLNIDPYIKSLTLYNKASSKQEFKKTTAQKNESNSGSFPIKNTWSRKSILPKNKLRQLNTVTQLKLKQLQINQKKYNNISATIAAQNGIVVISKALAYQGDATINGLIKIDTVSDIPKIFIQKSVMNLPIQSLYSKPKAPHPITGTMNLETTLKTQGNSMRNWISHLSGDVNFTITNGVLSNSNLEEQLCHSVPTVKTTKVPKKQEKETAFNRIKGSLTIGDGIAYNADLTIDTHDLKVTGRGQIDLNLLGLDYYPLLKFKKNKAYNCTVDKKVAHITWPFICKGSLASGIQSCHPEKRSFSGINRLLTIKNIPNEILTDQVNQIIDKLNPIKNIVPQLQDSMKGLDLLNDEH